MYLVHENSYLFLQKNFFHFPVFLLKIIGLLYASVLYHFPVLCFVLTFVVFISCKPQNKEIDSGDDWRDSFSPTPEALKSKIAISCKNIPTDGLMAALTFGQSNHGNHGGTPRSASGNVYEFYDGKCYPAKEPLFGATGNKGSVWTRLGDKIILTKLYDNVLFVSRAYGGTKIEQWKCGSVLSGKVIGSIRELRGKNIKLSHLLWQQGEVDNTEQTSRKDYKINFHEMLSCIRKETDKKLSAEFSIIATKKKYIVAVAQR